MPDPRAGTPSPLLGTLADAIFVGAGDIGQCGSAGPGLTAALLDRIPGTVFAAGDNAYPSGRSVDYQNCYDPTWGRHKARTKPIPGNHEYENDGAATGYFSYFGSAAGPSGLGYYSYNLESWHVVALNSSIPIDVGSPQLTWLANDLAQNPNFCTIAYFHHPAFSSGWHGNHPHMRLAWQVLYDFGADVAIAGHDHDYERFSPQDADGVADSERGIREFVVGTGGSELSPFVQFQPNSEVRASTWGVLKLRLRPGQYEWEFIPAGNANVADFGSGVCH